MGRWSYDPASTIHPARDPSLMLFTADDFLAGNGYWKHDAPRRCRGIDEVDEEIKLYSRDSLALQDPNNHAAILRF